MTAAEIAEKERLDKLKELENGESTVISEEIKKESSPATSQVAMDSSLQTPATTGQPSDNKESSDMFQNLIDERN